MMMFSRNILTKTSRSLVKNTPCTSNVRHFSYMNDVLDDDVRRRMFSASPGDVDPLEETARSAFAKSCYQNIAWKISEHSPGNTRYNKFNCIFYSNFSYQII